MNPSRTTRPVRRTCSALAAAMIAMGAILLLGTLAHAHGGIHVTIKNYMFTPTALTIAQGESVIWTNEDVAAHNVVVTSGPTSFSSPMIAQGKSWSHSFTVAGPYSYICSVHPGMTATLDVTAAPAVARAGAAPGGTVVRAVHIQGKVPASAKATTGPVAAPSTLTTAPTLVSAPPAAATLQPLLLVVGAAVAAVVLCLLLMASRPIVAGSNLEDEEPSVPKHLDPS